MAARGHPFTSFRAGAGYLNLIAQPSERGWSWWGRAIFYVTDVDALHERALAAGSSRPPRHAMPNGASASFASTTPMVTAEFRAALAATLGLEGRAQQSAITRQIGNISGSTTICSSESARAGDADRGVAR